MSARRIYKYAVTTGGKVAAPTGRLVHFGPDPSGLLCVWVDVDPDALDLAQEWLVVGTGWGIPDGWTPTGRGCVVGITVWHLLERAS